MADKTASKPAPEVPVVAPPPSVTITKPDGTTQRFLLVVPTSLGLKNQVTWGGLKNEVAAPMAALALCSLGVRKLVGPYDHDLFGYGMRVMDALLAEGFGYFDLLDAGNVAWRLMSDGILTRKELDEVEDFTDPGTAGPT